MSTAPASPTPVIASTSLLVGVLLCLLASLAWVESQHLNQPLMLTLNAWLVGQPAGPVMPLMPAVNAWWSGVTVMGLGLSMFLVFGAAARKQPGWIAAYIFCLLIGGLMVHLLKNAIDSPRPAAVLPLDQLHVIGSLLRTRSMPSGHSASALAFAAVILLTPNPRPLRRWLLAPALTAAALIALSRIAVGAHWPLDVLVGGSLGWLFGGISVVLAGATGFARWCGSRKGQWVLTIVWFGAALAMGPQKTGYPQAEPMQWALGAACALGALWRARSLWLEGRAA